MDERYPYNEKKTERIDDMHADDRPVKAGVMRRIEAGVNTALVVEAELITLRASIDKALDIGDKEAFMKLTARLNELQR